jgi:hypothetical protein
MANEGSGWLTGVITGTDGNGRRPATDAASIAPSLCGASGNAPCHHGTP